MSPRTLQALAFAHPGAEPARHDPKDDARRRLAALLAGAGPELEAVLAQLLAGAGPEPAPVASAPAPAAPPNVPAPAGRASGQPSAPPHVCSWCKRVREANAAWVTSREYLRARGHAPGTEHWVLSTSTTTHGICPECYLAVACHAGDPR